MARINKSPKVTFKETDLTTIFRKLFQSKGKSIISHNSDIFVTGDSSNVADGPTTTTSTTVVPTTTTTTTEEPTTTTTTTEEPTTTTTTTEAPTTTTTTTEEPTTTTTTVAPTTTTTTTDDGLYEYFMSEPVLTQAELCNQSFNLQVKHSQAQGNNWNADTIKNMDGSTYFLPTSDTYWVVVARADLSPSLYNESLSVADTTQSSPGVYINKVQIYNSGTQGALGISAYGWYGSTCPPTTTTTTTTVAPTTTTTTVAPTTTTTTTEEPTTTTTTTINYAGISYQLTTNVTPMGGSFINLLTANDAEEVICGYQEFQNAGGGGMGWTNVSVSNNSLGYLSVGDTLVNTGYIWSPSNGYYVYYDGNGYMGSTGDLYVIRVDNGAVTSIENFNDVTVNCNQTTTTTVAPTTTTTTTSGTPNIQLNIQNSMSTYSVDSVYYNENYTGQWSMSNIYDDAPTFPIAVGSTGTLYNLGQTNGTATLQVNISYTGAYSKTMKFYVDGVLDNTVSPLYGSVTVTVGNTQSLNNNSVIDVVITDANSTTTTTTTAAPTTTTTTTAASSYSLRTNYSSNAGTFRESDNPTSNIITHDVATGSQTGAILYNVAYLHTGSSIPVSYSMTLNGNPYTPGTGVIDVSWTNGILLIQTAEQNPNSVYNVVITL